MHLYSSILLKIGICFLILLLENNSLFAKVDISVSDQDGKPLANAILAISTSHTDALDTETIYVVDQVNKTFDPLVRIVPKDAFVEFPNSDNIRHHIYSFSKPKPFEVKLYAGKPEKPVKFDNTGVVVLGCNVHDSMVGYIYVTDTSASYKSDATGRISLTELPTDIKSATLWHPNATDGVETLVDVKQQLQNSVEVLLSMDITPPKARNTFKDVFRNK